MNARRLYISECLLLLSVATPLALAEGSWISLGLTGLCALIGWQRTVQQDRPLLGPAASRLVVIGAFLLLIFEYFRDSAISVIALSHFMVAVCLTKLLQRRSYRDHAQFFVLVLLLLVVAAIVSGNLLFPIALAVFLTVGLDALIRFHLDIEKTRARHHNRLVDWSNAVFPATSGDEVGTTRFTVCITLASSLLGVVIFLLCPRLAANSLFPRFDSPRVAQSVTGFTNTLNFNTIGQITESDQPVMRVTVDVSGRPLDESEPGPYFRGIVLTQYRCDHPASGTGWEWKRAGSGGGFSRSPLSYQVQEDGYIDLLPDAPLADRGQVIEQRYYLEPGGDNLTLFTLFPAVRLRPDSPIDVRKSIDDQTLQIQRPPGRTLKYTVESFAHMTGHVADLLAQERRRTGEDEPQVVPPELPSARAAEILEQTAFLREGLGALDVPENRARFAEKVEEFLKSDRFTYTLEPPRYPRGEEPVGEFLLHRRTGHCEYFASAMALICQLHGVPARVVAGYCGGDYNPVGHFYVVRQKHAHSWVEVFIPGRDWQSFDPTPATRVTTSQSNRYLAALSRYIDYLQFQWANLVISYDADQRRSLFEKFSAWLLRPSQNEDTILGAVSAFIRELFGWRLKLNWEERLIYWVFALLVMTLVLLVGYVVSVGVRWVLVRLARLQRYRVSSSVPPELEFYIRFCRCLDRWGIRRGPGQTSAELAAELASRLPPYEDAPDLVDAYYAVAFGGKRLAPAHCERIESFLSRLAAAPPPEYAPPAGVR